MKSHSGEVKFKWGQYHRQCGARGGEPLPFVNMNIDITRGNSLNKLEKVQLILSVITRYLVFEFRIVKRSCIFETQSRPNKEPS